jgi:nucleoside transporter
MSSTGTPAPLRADLRLKFSIMMFLQFAIWGSWFVVFFDYLLKTIKFNGTESGFIFGNMALGAIIANMFIGQLADRYFDSEKLMGVLHLLGAGVLYYMAQISTNSEFALYMGISLTYAILYNGTLTLANSITFAHVPSGERDFPGLRVLGTIGWIAANFYIGRFCDLKSNEPLILAAQLSVAMGLFCFVLPKTPPSGKSESYLDILGKALGLFRDRSFAVFFILSGLITIVLAFYYSNTATYLTSLDPKIVPPSVEGYFVKDVPAEGGGTKQMIDPASTMLIGQVVEMVLLPFLPLVLRAIGMKWVLVIGMLSWGIRYLLFSQCQDNFWLVLLGVGLHGVCFDFFFAAGFIHVDNTAPRDIRASGQALFSFLTYGLGMWLGSIASGRLNDYYRLPGGGTDWTNFWLVPSAGVLAAVAVFVLFFRSPRRGEGASHY